MGRPPGSFHRRQPHFTPQGLGGASPPNECPACSRKFVIPSPTADVRSRTPVDTGRQMLTAMHSIHHVYTPVSGQGHGIAGQHFIVTVATVRIKTSG